MNFSSVLEYLEYYRHDDLISHSRYKMICDKMKNLPVDISELYGFECIINQRESDADFSFNVIPGEAANILKDSIYKGLLEPGIIKNFNSFWFEYDITEDETEPGIFIEINEKTGNDIIKKIPGILNKTFENKIFKDNIDSVLKTVNEYGFIKYTGYFPSRHKEILRISLVIRDHKILEDLIELVYPGESIVDESFVSMSNIADYLILNIDIGKKVIPSYSVEFRLNEIKPENQERWYEILNILHKNGFCTGKKHSALCKWKGEAWEMFNPELSNYYTFRLINHFKVTYKPGFNLVWKAYFGFINKKIK